MLSGDVTCTTNILKHNCSTSSIDKERGQIAKFQFATTHIFPDRPTTTHHNPGSKSIALLPPNFNISSRPMHTTPRTIQMRAPLANRVFEVIFLATLFYLANKFIVRLLGRGPGIEPVPSWWSSMNLVGIVCSIPNARPSRSSRAQIQSIAWWKF